MSLWNAEYLQLGKELLRTNYRANEISERWSTLLKRESKEEPLKNGENRFITTKWQRLRLEFKSLKNPQVTIKSRLKNLRLILIKFEAKTIIFRQDCRHKHKGFCLIHSHDYLMLIQLDASTLGRIKQMRLTIHKEWLRTWCLIGIDENCILLFENGITLL